MGNPSVGYRIVAERSSVPGPEGRKDLDGSDDPCQLHEISTLLIQEDNLDALYSRVDRVEGFIRMADIETCEFIAGSPDLDEHSGQDCRCLKNR
jgi:hypothetical protein